MLVAATCNIDGNLLALETMVDDIPRMSVHQIIGGDILHRAHALGNP